MQNVGSVVVGALIALAGTVIVQLWLIPRVESRKRREERWEADVRALGEALIFSEPEAISEVRGELFWRSLFSHPSEDVNPDRLDALKREREEAWRTAWSDYDQILLQVGWLVDRVKAVAPGSRALVSFEERYQERQQTQMMFGFLKFTVDQEPTTLDALDQRYKATQKATSDLVDEVKRLADGRPPRDPTWVGRRLLSMRSRLRSIGRKPGA